MYRDLKQHFWWHGMKRKIESSIRNPLSCMPVSQGGTPEDGRAATTTPYSRMKVREYNHRLCYRPA